MPRSEKRGALRATLRVVAATAEELVFTGCLAGLTFSLFPPVARWLLRRSVALQQPALSLLKLVFNAARLTYGFAFPQKLMLNRKPI